MLKKIFLFSLLFSFVNCSARGSLAPNYFKVTSVDTTYFFKKGQLEYFVPKRHAYHQTLTLKLFMSGSKFDGNNKRRDNGESEIFLNFEQTLDVIKKIDNLTIGIPKIVYVVGWQYNGHDSKYPAFFEGNTKLKLKQDANSLESLKWLMHEASKYNTTVSLHINMFDAYDDSPLWNEYVNNDIIAKNIDGTLRACEWGWPISYAQEWKTGFTKKRIDRLCSILPLSKAGTIHIDAFHTWPPVPVTDSTGKISLDFTKGPISPFLRNTVKDETDAQINIFKYWASKGIDVTSEGVDFLRESAFEGYQPMAWWYGGLDHYLKWPASYYCGGQDNSEWGKLFGTSMHGEDIVMKDPQGLSGFTAEFCSKTLVWYFLNKLERKYLVTTPSSKYFQFSEDVKTFISADNYIVKQGNVTLVENDDILMPALWIKNKSLIAYSKRGYENKKWTLPKGWSTTKYVRLTKIGINGKSFSEVKKIYSGKLTLTLKRDEMILIENG